jgi:membrane glycosyltransferase
MHSCPDIRDHAQATRFGIVHAAGRSGERAAQRRDRGAVHDDVSERARMTRTPPISRSPMAPRAWPGSKRPRERAASTTDRAQGPHRHGSWSGVATRRRFLLVGLIAGQTWLACEFMVRGVLPYHGQQPLELAILCLFAILFAWISAGFWTAIAGFATLVRGRDRFSITRTIPRDARAGDIPADARTAIVMPICNEDVARVFAGLRATYESLAATGAGDRFDFFVLSDSTDPDTRTDELAAWIELCRAVDGFGRIFYRCRKHRIKRKSGNVADFCRRWGRNYRYMVVLDADSVMSGECLARLVLMAEANPGAGIIQTVPRPSGRDTLYARVQQFASCAYGPVFTAGLHFWQIGESHYWGHNAIIRVAPFIEHCALGRLPGRGALSGEILSHDFVEAALMRRAGWSVWIAYDLPGSYEEMPPNLVDELSRDHRWCQGNLMNTRLLPMKGIHPAHRAVFVTGVMAYLSAPLWFLLLVLATALVAVHALTLPEYFVRPFQLFPRWPEWRPERALALLSITAAVLFLPKILASLLVPAEEYGGRVRLALSVIMECVVSALLAPVRMLFHTQFVVASLLGRAVRWRSPQRSDARTDWGEGLRRHGVHTVLGVAWGALIWWLDPGYLPWFLPVVGALALSVPLSVYSSRAALGKALRRLGLFVVPEEARTPPVLRAMRAYVGQAGPSRGVMAAVFDPVVNAVACAQARKRPSTEAARLARCALVERALRDGVETLPTKERAALIADPEALSHLHASLWRSDALASWRVARDRGRMRSPRVPHAPARVELARSPAAAAGN